MSKLAEFEGYESKLFPREWVAQARGKFPMAAGATMEDAHVHHAAASFLGPALTLWLSFIATMEPRVLLSWERLERFTSPHLGRLEALQFILPKFDALILDSAGSITSYVSKFQTLLVRVGPNRSVADNVHRSLHGLPANIANQLRLKFARC